MFRITPTGDRLPVKSKYQNICWCGQRSFCRSECFCRVFLVCYRIVKTLCMNWKQVLRMTINCKRFFIVLRQFWSFGTGRVTPDRAPVFNQINLVQMIQPWKTTKPETGKFGAGIFLNSSNSAAESGPRHWPRVSMYSLGLLNDVYWELDNSVTVILVQRIEYSVLAHFEDWQTKINTFLLRWNFQKIRWTEISKLGEQQLSLIFCLSVNCIVRFRS